MEQRVRGILKAVVFVLIPDRVERRTRIFGCDNTMVGKVTSYLKRRLFLAAGNPLSFYGLIF